MKYTRGELFTDYSEYNCPVHGIRMLYSLIRDEYACQFASCEYGSGISGYQLALIDLSERRNDPRL